VSATSPVRLHASRVGIHTRHHGANAPQTHAARRDLAAARLEQYIRQTVDQAPLLSAEQCDRLALLLRGASASPTRSTAQPAA
jgi:hypothetical protein